MKIRPRSIPKFQNGTFNLSEWIQLNPEYYKWYSSIYPNALVLQGSPLKLRNDFWNKNQLSSSHYTTDDLLRSAYNNYLYTNDYDAREEDLTRWGESQSDFGTISDQDFVNRYNTQALIIRDAREAPQTYNKNGYANSNRVFRNMFYNRSKQGTNTPLYTIGYQENIDDIEGTSTWQRRMDRYEKPFNEDTPEGQKNRIFYITRPDGTKIKVYKKLNGNIGLFNDPNDPESPKDTPQNPQQNPQEEPKKPYSLVGYTQEGGYGFDWNKIGEGLRKYGPDLLAAGRLAGNLWNNERVFRESEKGIRPDLKQTYYTHRQVVGDEATRQGYYRRAAQGLTAAARPFTSDADRQMAYLMEAKRVGDEMRAQGDLADNQEIRRTSDESNQHLWANTQRATEVANANTAAINYANALRLNLRAQKQSADWTSIDNELLARETRLRQKQARADAIRDLIWALDTQNKLENNQEYLDAQTAYNNAYEAAVKKHTDSNKNVNWAAVKLDPEFKKALLNYRNIQYRYLRLQLEDMLTRSAKEGMKFTFKSKDDLLYKTARDAADHFRKMSKISSDAYNRKRIKIEKLTSHPKGNARRKYLQGGAAPFTIYRPATLGGETTTSSQTGGTTTSSSKASGGKDKNETLDMVKKLFEAVAGKGLPSDVNTLYNQMLGFLARAEAFGSDLSTDDIASMYLSQMQQLNTIQYMKADFDKAKEKATSNEALDEFAVTLDGKVVAQNAKGEIKRMSWDEVKKDKDFNPLTNRLLLSIRALSPEYAFKNDGILDIVGNGIGMNKISEWIRTNLPTMGTSENKLEGYTKQESHKIIKGIEILKDAPAGDYKLSELTKDLKDLAEAALKYIAGIMPRNMRAVLGIHADLSGTTPAALLTSLVSSKTSTTYLLDIDADSGKSSKDSDTDGDSTNSAGLAFVMGQGPRELIEFNTGTSYAIRALGIKGVLLTNSQENLGLGATLLDATKSQQGGYLLWSKATFGGSRLNSSAYNHIILNDSTIMGLDLPYTKDINGNTVPDFLQLRKMELADDEIRMNNILSNDYANINKIYLKHGLPPKYSQDGKLNLLNYMRFAAMQVTLDEQSLLNKDAILSDEIALAGDVERDLYEQSMKKQNKDYSLSDGFFGLGKDNLYKGTIFVPYDEDIAFAAISSGKPLKQDIPNNVAKVQLMQYAPATLTYKSPEITLSQIKNS